MSIRFVVFTLMLNILNDIYFVGKWDFKALLSKTQESIDKFGPGITKTSIENILKEEWKVFIQLRVTSCDLQY